MAIDYSVLFPTPMLVLGTTPQSELEVALARGYNRWLVRNVLPSSDAIRTMLYLPLSDPDASVAFIEEFAEEPGVLGFLVTAVRYQPIHENRFMKVFAALDERGLPLAFHSAPNWGERSFEQLNKFIGVHALGFPFFAMLQLTNLVYNGIPERFPRVPIVFMEAGISWLAFMVGRLDAEYRLRSSEAPLLTKMPSDYIREFFYTSQPIDPLDDPEHNRMLFELFRGDTQLLYSSDYPHQDFDLPTVISDLGFLSHETRRKILGGNAARLFGLEDVKLSARHPELFA
jgi:predicted TIM-barrel fold metal-dependent hydrolase